MRPGPAHAQQLVLLPPLLQHITKYTEREIINHMKLRHPHVIALREVRMFACRCPTQLPDTRQLHVQMLGCHARSSWHPPHSVPLCAVHATVPTKRRCSSLIHTWCLPWSMQPAATWLATRRRGRGCQRWKHATSSSKSFWRWTTATAWCASARAVTAERGHCLRTVMAAAQMRCRCSGRRSRLPAAGALHVVASRLELPSAAQLCRDQDGRHVHTQA